MVFLGTTWHAVRQRLSACPSSNHCAAALLVHHTGLNTKSQVAAKLSSRAPLILTCQGRNLLAAVTVFETGPGCLG